MGKNGKDLVLRQVVFNPHDLLQEQLIAHCKRYSNFSGYIKRLIERDMYEQNGRPTPNLSPICPTVPVAETFEIEFNVDLVV